MIDLLLKNGVLSDGSQNVELAIDQGFITNRGSYLNDQARQVMDLHGCFDRSGFCRKPCASRYCFNESGRPSWASGSIYSPLELNQAMQQRRKQFTREDIEQRAGRALEMLLAMA